MGEDTLAFCDGRTFEEGGVVYDRAGGEGVQFGRFD